MKKSTEELLILAAAAYFILPSILSKAATDTVGGYLGGGNGSISSTVRETILQPIYYITEGVPGLIGETGKAGLDAATRATREAARAATQPNPFINYGGGNKSVFDFTKDLIKTGMNAGLLSTPMGISFLIGKEAPTILRNVVSAFSINPNDLMSIAQRNIMSIPTYLTSGLFTQGAKTQGRLIDIQKSLAMPTDRTPAAVPVAYTRSIEQRFSSLEQGRARNSGVSSGISYSRDSYGNQTAIETITSAPPNQRALGRVVSPPPQNNNYNQIAQNLARGLPAGYRG